jgi:NAD(P)-dependent dehydrogenase (short-subunit alcohol dehydrogenase family)
MRTDENKAMTHMRTQDSASDTSMKGKTVLFTGASRGMGRFAAIELARRGAEFLRADMGDAEDVCALAEAVLARGGSIDVLIHSAGGLPPSAERTREGVDRGFAQNFLGAFLLTHLLEERLLASAPARVIAVGSAAHRLLKQVDIDAFMHPGTSPRNRYHMGNYQMLSYQAAKLAVTTWIYGLARRWAGRGITANVLDPGIVKGQFGEQFEGPAPIRLMMNHVIPFFAAVGKERGSRPTRRSCRCPAGTLYRARKSKRAVPRSPSTRSCSSASTMRLRRGLRRSCVAACRGSPGSPLSAQGPELQKLS